MRLAELIALLLLVPANRAVSNQEPSISCSLATTTPSSWPRFENELFSIQIPPGYESRPIASLNSVAGKWVEKSDRLDRSSINFSASKAVVVHPPSDECNEQIGGKLAVTTAGIGLTGRYFVRASWPDPLGTHSWHLEVWADTENPEVQAEDLAAIRSVVLKGDSGGA